MIIQKRNVIIITIYRKHGRVERGGSWLFRVMGHSGSRTHTASAGYYYIAVIVSVAIAIYIIVAIIISRYLSILVHTTKLFSSVKSTPPPVVTVMTNISYDHFHHYCHQDRHHNIPHICHFFYTVKFVGEYNFLR